MHGTLLEDKKEEAADLYVYRVAEYKAKQIGRVTRLLKETAVDCILNYQQTNFTQKNFEKILKLKHETVKQVLSTGKVIESFKIGDAPFSEACDYMETCEYKCRPTKEIDEENLKEDTYNENFIMMNSEKIIQRIRNLFGDKDDGQFFFKKDDIIKRIRVYKNYPLVQIYAVLTHMIQDKNEYIIDKYGRVGHLINVGDYYLFQPSELDNKNISIFDRSVPIDYKRSMIKIQINDDLKKIKETPEITHVNKLDKKSIILESDSDISLQTKEKESFLFKELKEIENGKRIFEDVEIKFNLARKFTKEKNVPRGDKDENIWYKHCGIAIRKMAIDDKIPIEDLVQFLLEHIIDMLVYKDKLNLLNYLYSLKTISDKSLQEYIINYFNTKIIKYKKLIAIVFYNVKKREVLILNDKTNIWQIAEPEEEREINEIIDNKPNPTNFNNLVGFIDYEVKTGKFMVFKVKDILEKRNIGARCDGAGKKDTIKMLNAIVGYDKYNKENTKGIVQEELCCLQEFTLRYYNKQHKNNKIYFLDTESAKNFGF